MGDLYVEYEYVITFVQLAMAMFAMGATLHLRDFLAVIVLPRSFLTGLGAQMVLVPLLAYALLRSACNAPQSNSPLTLVGFRCSSNEFNILAPIV